LLFNPETAPGGGAVFLDPIEKAAPGFGLNWMPASVRNTGEIETICGVLGRQGATGILVMPDVFTTAHREQIIALVAQYRLPAVYAYRYFTTDGGLMSYGIDPTDPPPLKWSDLRYVFDIQEDCNGKEAIQA